MNSLSDFNVFFTILQCWKSEIASHDYQTIELPKPTGFRSFSKYFQSARQTSALAVCSEAPRPRNKKNEIRSEYGQVNFGPRLASFRVFVWKRPRHESSGRFLAFRLAAKVIGRRIRAARLASSWPFPGPQRTGLIRRSIERMALEFFDRFQGALGRRNVTRRRRNMPAPTLYGVVESDLNVADMPRKNEECPPVIALAHSNEPMASCRRNNDCRLASRWLILSHSGGSRSAVGRD